VAGMLQMVSEPTLMVSRARTSQVRRIRGNVRVKEVGTYAWRVGPLEGHSMIRMLLTGRAVHVCQYWTYGRGQEGTFLA
jgi:hypothetical protein